MESLVLNELQICYFKIDTIIADNGASLPCLVSVFLGKIQVFLMKWLVLISEMDFIQSGNTFFLS